MASEDFRSAEDALADLSVDSIEKVATLQPDFEIHASPFTMTRGTVGSQHHRHPLTTPTAPGRQQQLDMIYEAEAQVSRLSATMF